MIAMAENMADSKYKIASLDAKMMGGEPVAYEIRTEADLSRALNWYNYMNGPIYSGVDPKAKKWFHAYIKDNRPELFNAISKIPDSAVISTAAFMCRMIQNGFNLPEKNMAYLNETIERMANYKKKADKTQVKDVDGPKVSVVDRMAKKTERLITEIEETVDVLWENDFNDIEFSLYNFLNGAEAAPQSIKAIQEYYTKTLKAVEADKEFINKATYKKIETFYKAMLKDCDRLVNNKKIVRAPRAAKAPDTSKILAGLKYMKKFDPLKLVSIQPADILGAKQLWVYNTKYKMLGVYNAKDAMGFKISSTTLLNFDEATSICKTVRKPEEALDAFMKAGKVELKQFLAQFKTTETKLASRINDSIILLKAIR